MSEKIFIACDHAGLNLKTHLIKQLHDGFLWADLGTNDETSVDYPDFADRVADELKKNPHSLGVLICGSGQGMAIRANRHRHIRAALCWNEDIAILSRAHNNANVLCMGARFIEPLLANKILNSFLKTSFEGGRHEQRVRKLEKES